MEGADAYLMWPNRMGGRRDRRRFAPSRVLRGRTLRSGYRVHVLVRETEAAAHVAADRLLSRFDEAEGAASGHDRSPRSQRACADGSSCARRRAMTALSRTILDRDRVDNPRQVLAKLNAYGKLNIDAFILSGCPPIAAADLLVRHLMPGLDRQPLNI
ncbi:hypothetical protein MZO42_07080 [Sphingomonas psychrotolerans]|uniref:LLM class flavin-dependent oxidoreductase n=1 Tax=Sphingomonas psychrotolerans TaxID=1327635 RepID=A0ABU3N1N6_9SPHN|nr:hypothetical protein [Sphingomonas psychrotolerans]